MQSVVDQVGHGKTDPILDRHFLLEGKPGGKDEVENKSGQISQRICGIGPPAAFPREQVYQSEVDAIMDGGCRYAYDAEPQEFLPFGRQFIPIVSKDLHDSLSEIHLQRRAGLACQAAVGLVGGKQETGIEDHTQALDLGCLVMDLVQRFYHEEAFN